MRKKQVLAVVSVAVVSFLIGTLFNMNLLAIGKDADDGSPWDTVWTAIAGLRSDMEALGDRVATLEYPKDGFVGYWTFDEATGQIVYDESGNRNDGRNYGAIWTDGRIGGALVFDGEDDYVEVMHSPTLYLSSMTVMAWVNIVEFPGYYGGVSMIVAKGTDDTQNGHFGLHQYYQGHSPSNPAIFHFYLTENAQWYAVDGTTSLVEGEWYHVAGTYDGSILKLYVNGVLEDEETINVTRTHNTQNLQIGALRMPNYEYWTDGIIDEVKIFNRALTAQEILEHYTDLQP